MFKFYTKNSTQKISKNRAFTLIELLVVMAIISLLSSLVLNSLASARMKANDTKITEDLRQFKIAAELYYNDNHTYPSGYTPGASKGQDLAYVDKNESWSKKLSFFVKTAEASGPVHTSQLCLNFDAMAQSMVAGKYLSAVPVHPYDDDSTGKGVCYKAIKNDKTFVSYAPLTTRIAVTNGSINKNTGFILGDTSISAVNDVNVAIKSTKKGNKIDTERPAFVAADGVNPVADLTMSQDAVDGFTTGAPAVTGGVVGSIFDIFTPSSPTPTPTCADGEAINTLGVCQALYTGFLRMNCVAPANQDPFSSGCIGENPTAITATNTITGGTLIMNLFTGIRINSATCPIGTRQDLYSDSCVASITIGAIGGGIGGIGGICGGGMQLSNGVCKIGHSGCDAQGNGPCGPTTFSYSCPAGMTFDINGLENTANGTCSTIPVGDCGMGSTLQSNGVCVSNGSACLPPGVAGSCPGVGSVTCPSGKTFLINGLEYTVNGTCQ
ncbi:MAG: type II secretion system protein [bacterium]